ncbi:MAG: MATE family efflux transporter [Ruminococcus sp.]|nr:MATE family efflux transporter [Ruminococcus sp.]
MKTKNTFHAKLFALVVPIAFQQLMLALVSASDALMLGFISQEALSAVSQAGQVMFVYTLFQFALTSGAAIFAAQYYGKGDIDSVEKILGIVLKFNAGISFLFTVGAVFTPKLLMSAFTNQPELIEMGAQYLRVVGPSYLMMGISQAYLCILKNCGRASTSSMISSVSMLLNIVMNFFLIFGIALFPRMGIRGAALATLLSRVIELIWALSQALKKDSIKFRRKYIFGNDKVLFRDYCKYTTPILGNELVWGCGFAMFSVIMGRLGTDAIAANSIANIVKNILICFCMGTASAGGIMVGNQLGQGRLDTAKEYGSKTCKTALVIGLISGGLILAVSPFVVRFANLSETAAGYLQIMLIVCSYYVVGKTMNTTTIAGIFCAGGDSKFGFICDTITMWVIVVPIGLISAFVLKLPVVTVYILMNIDEIIKLPAVYIHYKKYKWLKDLTRNNKDVSA